MPSWTADGPGDVTAETMPGEAAACGIDGAIRFGFMPGGLALAGGTPGSPDAGTCRTCRKR